MRILIVLGLLFAGCAGTRAVLVDHSATGLYVCGYMDDRRPRIDQDLQCVSAEQYQLVSGYRL